MKTYIDNHGIVWVWPEPYQMILEDAMARVAKDPCRVFGPLQVHDECWVQVSDQDFDFLVLKLAYQEWLAKYGKDLQLRVDVEWKGNWEKVGKKSGQPGWM